MAKQRDIKIEAAIWNKFSTIVNSTKWMKDVLGNTARYMHRMTVHKFMQEKHKISGATMKIRKNQGITGRQPGIAEGKLSRALFGGTSRDSGSNVQYGGETFGGRPVPYRHPAVKYYRDGYTIGENYPEYTKYYEGGWTQTFTARQAAFLTYALAGNFNFGLWKSLVGTQHSAPARPFNYLTSNELQKSADVTAKSIDLLFDKLE